MKHEKICAFVLTICLFVTSNILVFSKSDFENNGGEVLSDEILYKLGIVPDSVSFSENSYTTRGMFAKILSNLLGGAPSSSGANNVLSDVESGSDLDRVANYMTYMGYINAFPDGSFRPDESITYGQAVYGLLRILGYGYFAETRGGYPNGYLIVASEKRLTKGNGGDFSEPLSNRRLAQLLNAAIDIDLMTQKSFGASPQFIAETGKTLVTEYMEIYKKTGVFDATNETTLSRYHSMKKGQIKIGGELFHNARAADNKYFGYEVDVYYKENDSGDNLIVYLAPTRNNTTLVIQKKDIEVNTNYRKIDYRRDNKSRTADISVIADFIYNGKALGFGDRTIERLQIADVDGNQYTDGSLILIDNNQDNKYDVVIIDAYRNILVDHIEAENHIIHDKLLPDRPIVINTEISTTNILKGAGEIAFTDIRAWDVLSVRESVDSLLYTINVTNGTTAGTVEEIALNVTPATVTISGKGYDISKSYMLAMNAKAIKFTNINLNVSGVFYLSETGEVLGSTVTSARDFKYGYLIKAAVTEGFVKALQFKVFTEDGKVEVLEVADRLTVYSPDSEGNVNNSVYKKGNQNIKSAANMIMPEQVIRYNVDDNNNVTEVYLPYVCNVDAAQYDYSDMISKIRKGTFVSSAKANLQFNQEVFQSIINPGNFTKYLITSRVSTAPDAPIDEESFRWVNRNDVFMNSTNYTIQAAGINEFMCPDVIVAEIDQNTFTISAIRERRFFVINKIVTAADSDGVNFTRVYGVENNQNVVIEFKDTYQLYDYTIDESNGDRKDFAKGNPLTASDLKSGDILQVLYTGSNKEVLIALRAFKADDYLTYNSTNPSATTPCAFLYGEVEKVDYDNSFIIMQVKSPASYGGKLWAIRTMTPTAVWEHTSQKITARPYVGTDLIREGDYVLIRAYYYATRDLIIVRF